MARCVIAYMRDSWSGSSPGEMQAAIAAFPAFAFQALTASERGRPVSARRGGDRREGGRRRDGGKERAHHRGTGAR